MLLNSAVILNIFFIFISPVFGGQTTNEELSAALRTISTDHSGKMAVLYYDDAAILIGSGGNFSAELYGKNNIDAIKAAAETKGIPIKGYRETYGIDVDVTCFSCSGPLAGKNRGKYSNCTASKCSVNGLEKSQIRYFEILSTSDKSSIQPGSVR